MYNSKGIQEVCKSIKSSLNNENYFAAISTSLILIDICSKIYSSKELQNNERYKKWINDILLPSLDKKNEYLSADNIYFLRTAILHEGSSNPKTNKYYLKYGNNIVHDIVPTIFPNESERKVLVANQGKKYPTLFFDINYFCKSITKAVKKWIENNPNSIQQANLSLFSLATAFINQDGNFIIIRRMP